MFPSFSVAFPLLRNLKRNLEISTQESNANSTEISIYKTQFLTCNSEKKGQEGSLSKHGSRNVLKGQILIDSIIPWSWSEFWKCVPNSNHEVFVMIFFIGFLYLC